VSDGATSLESTRSLARRAQDGEAEARERLIERCLPLVRRWARGRLPHYARDLSDTDDLVQTTLIRTLDGLDRMRLERTGSFLAYLRQVLLNEARQEMRRSSRRKESGTEESLEKLAAAIPEGLRDRLSPDMVLDYERALDRLSAPQREAVVLRLEFGLSYPEIALELESPSANAARMTVSRSLARLAEDLGGADNRPVASG
jgi:RNA polymerase sigma-70 factor (ECF subfamily)